MSSQMEFYTLNGMQMIEAAAGTGKTYNIQNLVLRLLLEYPPDDESKAITIDRILVVTYTKAATAELRSRIWKILRFALNEINNTDYPERAGEQERIKSILNHAMEEFPELNSGIIKMRIQNALADFDSNMIFTIHGFCQRILRENSFRSEILFNTEILENPDEIIHDIIMDFYRREFYVNHLDDKINFNLCLQKVLAITPELIVKFTNKRFNHLNMVIIPEFEPVRNHLEVVKEAKYEFQNVCSAFYPGVFTDWEIQLDKKFKKTELEKVEEVLENGSIIEKLQILSKYTLENIGDKMDTPKGKNFIIEQLKQNPFFAAVDKLNCRMREYEQTLMLEASDYAIEKFEMRKTSDNFQTFNDFLTRVASRLHDPQTGKLSDLSVHLREKLQVAIVDEFQDTDPLQYNIFHTLFGDRCLFMVGDPRQAIYGFRGGDIAAYNQAKKNLNNEPHKLNRNFRSSSSLIAAVNNIFHDHFLPFGDSGITFPVIQSRAGAPECTCRGEPLPPVKITFLGKMRKSPAAAAAIQQCAKQIRKLLDKSSQIEIPRPEHSCKDPFLLPEDIAVLCNSNNDCTKMKQELAKYNIPAVIDRGDNVFDSDAAKDLAVVFNAIAVPSKAELVIRAMSTRLIGCDIPVLVDNNLTAKQDNSAENMVNLVQIQFHNLHKIWLENSFVEMFQKLLDWNSNSIFESKNSLPGSSIRSNLLRKDNGERYLTDLLHLRELLSKECQKKNLSISGLLAFFDRQRNMRTRNSNEEYETLLDTDRASVILMTIHHSKGLEFPMVFLPTLFTWEAGGTGKYHGRNGEIIYKLNPDEESKKLITDEQLQEALRLAYVGLTRAKYYCHVYWADTTIYPPARNPVAPVKRSINPLDWLFRLRNRETVPIYGELAETLNQSSNDGLNFIENWKCEPLEEDFPPYLPKTDHLLPKEELCFSRKFDYSWQITSFSGLTHNHTGSGKDYDDWESDEFSACSEGIFEIPGNAKTGNAWHEILEKTDFKKPENSTDLISVILTKFRVLNHNNQNKHDRFIQLTAQMVKTVALLELPEVAKGFTLSMLGRTQRLNELEFHYGFHKKFSSWELKTLLDSYVEEKFHTDSWSLPKNIVTGYLKGFIDMIFYHEGKFYIVDWKSNCMGGNIKNFQPARIEKEMVRHLYFVQYLIYSIALIKFIKLKLNSPEFSRQDYEKYYGGIYYLFLRGISPRNPGQGVWFERPDFELLKELENIIG